MTDQQLFELSQKVGAALQARGATVTTAESCTGGWIAKVLTDVAGSSAWFRQGIVTYSNEAKQQMIGVNPAMLETQGAVSEEVVREMVVGSLHLAGADFAVSVSGIAGPDGGTADKPVGTVWLACGDKHGQGSAREHHFEGDRDAVRRQATAGALLLLWETFLQN